MEETLVSTSTIVWLAFAIGALFGLVAHRTNFCTMGAVSDIVNMGDWNRMRMWALAIAIAILGTGALQWLGLFDASKTLYTGSRLNWLGHLIGGACFGIAAAQLEHRQARIGRGEERRAESWRAAHDRRWVS